MGKVNMVKPRKNNRPRVHPSTRSPIPRAGRDTTKPPTTEAQLLAREARQDIFRRLQEINDRTLLCYVAWDVISEEDIRYLQELLHAVPADASLDLLLNSPGGSISAADKMVRMLWRDTEKSRSGEYRLIVPDQAKSAATLVALGASEIMMSTTSELGPIDPQVELQDQNGNWNWHSAFDYIETYEVAERNYRKKPDDPAFGSVFDRLDSVRFRCMEKNVEYTRKCAENILKRHGVNSTWAPSRLMDRNIFPLHGQAIDWETALHYLKLNVKFMDHHDNTWWAYWRLYGHLQSALEGYRKIFESAEVSLLVP